MSEKENATPDADETPPAEAAVTSHSALSQAADDPSIGTPRRNFVAEFMAVAVGAVVGIVPAAIGGLFFLDPLVRKRAGSGTGDGFVKTDLILDALPEDGTPIRYTVRDDLINAWNLFPDQPIGSAWLRRIQDQVLAFNTVCPHLGCAVEHRPSEGDFYCPCHTSAFDLDGKPLNVIPPRGMDTLEADVRDGGRIWLKYQEFRGATSEKVPV
ncbi:MAG: Rieske (2Fe-2S) protein [Rhodopirellula sp.]|nr:Rieske (2Fe-2S) protein [Rhodopirellula sp.]